jgi:hypothetical protein
MDHLPGIEGNLIVTFVIDPVPDQSSIDQLGSQVHSVLVPPIFNMDPPLRQDVGFSAR